MSNPAAITFQGALSSITASGNWDSYGKTATWSYAVELDGAPVQGIGVNSRVTFTITGNFNLQLGGQYVLSFVPSVSKTGGVICQTATVDGPFQGSSGSDVTYTYTLGDYINDGNPSPTFGAFVVSPASPLPFMVTQLYVVDFSLAPA